MLNACYNIRVKILIIYSDQIYAAYLLIAIVYVINGGCRRGQQTLRENLAPIYHILAPSRALSIENSF